MPRGSTSNHCYLCALRGRRMAVALERLSGLGFSQQNHSLDKIKAQFKWGIQLNTDYWPELVVHMGVSSWFMHEPLLSPQRPRQVRLLAAAGGVYARVVAAAGTQLPAPHLEDLKKRFSRWQKRVVADALRRRSSGA